MNEDLKLILTAIMNSVNGGSQLCGLFNMYKPAKCWQVSCGRCLIAGATYYNQALLLRISAYE